MKIKHIMTQEHQMEETSEESDNDIIEYIYDCNCLKKRIKQRIRHLIIAPLTAGEVFCLCIYQFMITCVMYVFILRMNIVEYCLRIFANIIGDNILTETIIEWLAQTIKIMMMLYLFEELRIFIKALLCNCDTMN